MTIDNQLNQINNYKNKYIFDFNQKFELTSIKADKTRYFIGTLLSENSSEKNNLNLALNNRISHFVLCQHFYHLVHLKINLLNFQNYFYD